LNRNNANGEFGINIEDDEDDEENEEGIDMVNEYQADLEKVMRKATT
jgi:hypothetical protein